MTISIVYSIMTTIRVGGAKSCPEGEGGKNIVEQYQYHQLVNLKMI